MSDIAHYRLKDGTITMSPQLGPCWPWLRQQEGKTFLCVMEGAAFHVFEIAGQSVKRLAAESTAIIFREAQQ